MILSILGLILIIGGAVMILWPTIVAISGNYEPFHIGLFIAGLVVAGIGVVLTILL